MDGHVGIGEQSSYADHRTRVDGDSRSCSTRRSSIAQGEEQNSSSDEVQQRAHGCLLAAERLEGLATAEGPSHSFRKCPHLPLKIPNLVEARIPASWFGFLRHALSHTLLIVDLPDAEQSGTPARQKEASLAWQGGSCGMTDVDTGWGKA